MMLARQAREKAMSIIKSGQLEESRKIYSLIEKAVEKGEFKVYCDSISENMELELKENGYYIQKIEERYNDTNYIISW